MPIRLPDEEISKRLSPLSHWKREGDNLIGELMCESYPAACAVVMQVAILAEKLDHHPDLSWSYRHLRFTLTTHDAGGISELDFTLASQIEALAKQ